MKQILISIGILILLILIAIIAYRYYRNREINKDSFVVPDKYMIDTQIDEKSESKDTIYVYFDDMLIDSLKEMYKEYCSQYNVEIYSARKAEETIRNYLGMEGVKVFRTTNDKEYFFGLIMLYMRGGCFLSSKIVLLDHINGFYDHWNEKLIICDNQNNPSMILANRKNSVIWNKFIEYYINPTKSKRKLNSSQLKIIESHKYIPSDFWNNLTTKSKYIHYHESLPKEIDKSKIDLPIVYINLDRNSDRREYMEKMLSGLKIHRIPGVIVDSLNDYPKFVDLRKNEIGCFLAHLDVWKFIIQNNLRDVLVLEDDACLKLSHYWTYNLSEIPSPWFLAWGTMAYKINYEYAKYFLERVASEEYINLPIDVWMYYELKIDDVMYDPHNVLTRRQKSIYYHIYSAGFISEIQKNVEDMSITDIEVGTNVIKIWGQRYCYITYKGEEMNENPKKRILILVDSEYNQHLLEKILRTYNNTFDIDIYHYDENALDDINNFNKQYNFNYFKYLDFPIYENEYDRTISAGDLVNIEINEPEKFIEIKNIHNINIISPFGDLN